MSYVSRPSRPSLFPMKWTHIVSTGCGSVSGTGGHLYTRSFRDPEFKLWPLHVVLESLNPLASVTTEALDTATLFSWNAARLPFGGFCSREWENETEREKKKAEAQYLSLKEQQRALLFQIAFFHAQEYFLCCQGTSLIRDWKGEDVWVETGKAWRQISFSEWARTLVKRFSYSQHVGDREIVIYRHPGRPDFIFFLNLQSAYVYIFEYVSELLNLFKSNDHINH